MTWWVVDGNNVMGAAGDGWWNDPPAAAARLTQAIAEWTRGHDDPVTVVFDGSPQPRLRELAGGNLAVDFATRSGRDAADDRIVEVVEDGYAERPEIVALSQADRPEVREAHPELAAQFKARFGVELLLVSAASRFQLSELLQTIAHRLPPRTAPSSPEPDNSPADADSPAERQR